jgi:hypothetical protein
METSSYRWELVVRKQADFEFVKELSPDDLFEIRVNSAQCTEKAVTVSLRVFIDMLEDIRFIISPTEYYKALNGSC